MSPFDLDAYLARIGHVGPRAPTVETLHAITAAHTRSIPFENLDILLGKRVDVDDASVFEKLVRDRRGGYCFEQNALLLRALRELGYSATPCSARVRIQRPRDFTPPRTHLFVRVVVDGVPWLTDVGVGGASLTAALRMDVGDAPQPTPNETRRLVHEDGRFFHQVLYGDTWNDVYEFTGEEMPLIDREVGNWYTSTHPQSHFRDRLIVARALPDGRRIAVVNRELVTRARDGAATIHPIDSADSLLTILEEHFALHFPPKTRFGPPRDDSPWPTR